MKEHQSLQERQSQGTDIDIKLLKDWNKTIRDTMAEAREDEPLTEEELDTKSKT